MKRILVATLTCALLAPQAASSAQPAPARRAPSPCPTGTAPLFAGGGTNLTNGVFFPGTAVSDGGKGLIGEPYEITKGCNIEFVNLDPGPVTNVHQIVSYKRRKGRPVFRSKVSSGPETTIMKTKKLKPRVYPYFCSVHFGMYGKLKVTKPKP